MSEANPIPKKSESLSWGRMKVGEAGFVVCVSIQQIPLFSSERRFPAGESEVPLKCVNNFFPSQTSNTAIKYDQTGQKVPIARKRKIYRLRCTKVLRMEGNFSLTKQEVLFHLSEKYSFLNF